MRSLRLKIILLSEDRRVTELSRAEAQGRRVQIWNEKLSVSASLRENNLLLSEGRRGTELSRAEAQGRRVQI